MSAMSVHPSSNDPIRDALQSESVESLSSKIKSKEIDSEAICSFLVQNLSEGAASLIEKGIVILSPDKKELTTLIIFLKTTPHFNKIETLQELLANCINVDNFPLFCSLMAIYEEKVRELKIPPDQVDQFIQPLLSRAAADTQHLKFASILMAKVASKEIKTKAQETPKSHFTTPAVADPSGKTPLHRAVLNGEISKVERLLKEGADCNAPDKFGNTPLHDAASINNGELVLLLIKYGANLESCNQEGETPLHSGIKNRSESVVKILLDKKVNIKARNNEGKSPLFLAIQYDSSNMIELLLENGAEIEEKDEQGLTPLLYAASQGNLPLITLLIQKGGNIDARDSNGLSIMHLAIVFQDEKMVQYLLDHGADLNSLSYDGRPPMSYLLLMDIALDRSFVKFIETIGGRWSAAQEIVDRQILAHIEGLEGDSHIELGEGISIKFPLEGLPHHISMGKLIEYFESFIELDSTREKWDDSSSFDDILSILEKFVDVDMIPSGPFTNPNKTVSGIAAKIQRGNTVVLIGGTQTHAINIIFINNKIIICNRGEGAEFVGKGKVKAGVVYSYPCKQVTTEFLSHFTKRLKTIQEFRKIFKDLNLTPPTEGAMGFSLKKQEVGNCTWASSKTSLFALLREYFGEDKGRVIYKAFTLYARVRALSDYKQNHMSAEKKGLIDEDLVNQAQAQITKTQLKTPLN